MPRKRTLSVELTEQDKQIVAGAALTLRAIASRHSNEKLALAGELADSFADGPTPQPKPRARKPKAETRSQVEIIMPRDGKSAAANDDTRELSHHGA